jgi:hypothetical protein
LAWSKNTQIVKISILLFNVSLSIADGGSVTPHSADLIFETADSSPVAVAPGLSFDSVSVSGNSPVIKDILM